MTYYDILVTAFAVALCTILVGFVFEIRRKD